MPRIAMMIVLSAVLAGCAGQPIKRTNCWSQMSFVEVHDCTR